MDTATEKLVATEEPGDVDLSESETLEFSRRGSDGETHCFWEKLRGNPMHPVKKDHPGSPKAERKEWSHNLHVSPATVHHMEAVFSIVRSIYGREHVDTMDDLDVNMAI